MARPSKPFFRKQTKSWYCSIKGRQISLGKDREAAHKKFHTLMADQSLLSAEITTIYELSQTYLDWCEKNRKKGTYDLHLRYLKSFIGAIGKQMRPAQLKVHHVTKWHESLGVGSTTQNDAVKIVQRLLNWSVEQDYISANPVRGMKRPKRMRRDIFYTHDQWKQIMSHANGPLVDLLDFLYMTGCRPQEARCIEARHVNGDLIIFPIDESKGEQESRVIYMIPKAKAIVDRLAKENPTGVVFRNSKGTPWTKNSIKCRLTRITKKVGFRVIAYGARHSWATNALVDGGVDPISVAHLMGHRDTTMVSRVYSHIAKNPDFLRKQAAKAVR